MKRFTTLMGWLVMAAAFIAGMTSCSKVDDIIDEPTTTTIDAPKTYTLTVTASKGSDDATTRALSLDGKTLNATWAAGDTVQVYHVSSPGTLYEFESNTPDGTLYAKGSGATTTLSGTFTGSYTPAVGDVLRLRFLPNPNYTTQEGTLDYIAANCDYAMADITVESVDALTGNVTATGIAEFANQQAIVKFSLKQPDGITPLAVTSLSVKVGSWTYNVTPKTDTSDIYVAIKGASNKTVTIRATDGIDFFLYEKTGVSFGLGKYYAIGVKMTQTSLNLSTLSSDYTAQDGDVLTGTLDGNTQPYKISIADGATVTLSGVTINGTNNASYSWAGITCLGEATIVLAEGTTNTVTGFYENHPGIQPAVGKTLTISGTGLLNSNSNGSGAGIGGGFGISCGNIHIESGTINATGSYGCAGIGCGVGYELGNSKCGTITISGGNVTATGSAYAAGIGSGRSNNGASTCGDILIEGGTVTATAGNYATAIGKGGDSVSSTYSSKCEKVTFTTGITSLTLKNARAEITAQAKLFLNAERVMADSENLSGSLDGYDSFVRFFNERNPYFYALFPNSSFDENTFVWTIAP